MAFWTPLGCVGLVLADFRCRGKTHAKLDGNGEVLNANSLCDLLTTRHAREVDVAGLDDT